MASRVTKEGRRFSAQGPGFKQQVVEQGAAVPITQGLGEMPLTLWIVSAAVILFLYIRRAHKGIDTHPGERAAAPVQSPQPRVPILPQVPGTWGPQKSQNTIGPVPYAEQRHWWSLP